MPNDEQIQIVSITDNDYVQHLGVALCSLLANKSSETRICLNIVFDQLTRVNQMRLELIAEHYETEIRFHPFDDALYQDAHTSNRITRCNYYKISMPSIPSLSTVKRAIYLDCDVIVTGDIAELWAADLTARVIGAVTDLGGASRGKDLNLPTGWPYFNAGVLLIDMEQWRARGITDKVAAFIRQFPHKPIYHDQDALNAILQAQWLELPARWNWQANHISKKTKLAKLPTIIHYTGSSKPWHYDNDHPYQGEYYRYLQMTGWRSYEPEKNRTVVMKRFTKRVLPRTAYLLLTKIKSVLTDR